MPLPIGRVLACSPCFALASCGLGGAPSYDMFGAHFPAWLLLAAIGIVAALVIRWAMIVSGLDDVMPVRLLTYTACGIATALWSWLGLFGDR